jgi:hypothetical protein
MTLASKGAEVASTAQNYATWVGILAGFAFGGLCIYLGRMAQSGEDSESERNSTPGDGVTPPPRERRRRSIRRIKVIDVAATLFFAMASLILSSFIYSNLAGEAETRPRSSGVAFLPYGVVLGLSVLILLYSVALMMLENSLTEHAARYAYWVVAIAGPVAVLRFLAGAARMAERLRHADPKNLPPVPWLFSFGGISALLIAATLVAVVITWASPFQRDEIWVMRKMKAVRDSLASRPSLPAISVFWLAFVIATWGSLYFSTLEGQDRYRPSAGMVYTSFFLGCGLVAFFALACGSVIGSRVQLSRTGNGDAGRLSTLIQRLRASSRRPRCSSPGETRGPQTQQPH